MREKFYFRRDVLPFLVAIVTHSETWHLFRKAPWSNTINFEEASFVTIMHGGLGGKSEYFSEQIDNEVTKMSKFMTLMCFIMCIILEWYMIIGFLRGWNSIALDKSCGATNFKTSIKIWKECCNYSIFIQDFISRLEIIWLMVAVLWVFGYKCIVLQF